MDEKDLEKESCKGKDITYGPLEPKIMTVNEARAAYSVDEEIEYRKYQNLPEDLGELVEFIDGKIFYLGSPTTKHQRLSGRLFSRFDNYLHGKPCEAFHAPFDVKIDYDFNTFSKNTLQPDLIVICDDEKIDEKRVLGTPDLVIEVLSPSNANHDKVVKYNKYLSAGVKEYWIVDPDREVVTVNILNKSQQVYIPTTYKKGDVIKVSIFDDLYIDVTGLFEGYQGEAPEVVVARGEGREEGSLEKAKHIAKKLLDTGESIEQTAEITGLAFEVLQEV